MERFQQKQKSKFWLTRVQQSEILYIVTRNLAKTSIVTRKIWLNGEKSAVKRLKKWVDGSRPGVTSSAQGRTGEGRGKGAKHTYIFRVNNPTS